MEEFCYLEFNVVKNTIEEKSSIKSFIEDLVIKIASLIFPKANPDFDKLYDKVNRWKIEFNIIENYTERELGFDKDGNLIVLAPHKENLGFWVDNNLLLDDYNKFKPSNITKEEFEKDWTSFRDK